MGVQVDFPCDPPVCTGGLHTLWLIFNNFFGVVYCLEMVLTLRYKRWNYFKGWTNKFDFILVLLTILDLWVLSALGQGGKIKAISVLRSMRYIRLMRIGRILNRYHSLYLIVHGTAELAKFAIPVIATGIIIIYSGAVISRSSVVMESSLSDKVNYNTIDKSWTLYEYWGTIPKSMFTLFQVCTGDWWSEHIARSIVFEKPLKFVFFFIFVTILQIAIPNLLVGTACEHVIFMGQLDFKSKNVELETERDKTLAAFRESLCSVEEKKLTRDDLKKALRSTRLRVQLAAINLPMAEFYQLFDLLDKEEAGSVDSERFVRACLEIRSLGLGRDITMLTVACTRMLSQVKKLKSLADNQDLLLLDVQSCIDKIQQLLGLGKRLKAHEDSSGNATLQDELSFAQRMPGMADDDQADDQKN